jgi:hypothetical protein
MTAKILAVVFGEGRIHAQVPFHGSSIQENPHLGKTREKFAIK